MMVKFIIRESLPLGIFSLLLTLIFKVDVFFLNWFGNKTDVALFESPHRLITQMQIFSMAISSSLFPVLSRFAGRNSNSSLQLYYSNTYKFLLIIGILISVLLFLGGRPLIVTLFGGAFRDAAASLKILSPIMVFLFLISLQNFFLTAIGRQLLNMVSISIALIINISLDILLIPHYSFIGASIATLISYFFLLMVNSYFVSKEGIRLNIWPFTSKIVLAGCLMLFATLINTHNNLETLLIRMGIGLIFYIFSVILFKILSYKEIDTVKDIFFKKYEKEEIEKG